ncbi:hypothetical protein BDA99DRAFT_562383 [Phascolomyces articulosus]|uniref:Uncharacterized protein n=1 Tax=Phascolomyces articulosus TaxID=60185 RepID=A0AAD5PB64_9FUNG|nr:hypothetical protein BDA99DRAFT_562383 [Phascolomyces articulosus]
MDDSNTIEPYQDLVIKLHAAIKNYNYQHAVNITDIMLRSHWLKIMDIRVYANAMRGKPDLALHDAQQIIESASDLTIGYIRKANTYSMYGYQLNAITVYEDGLRNTNTKHQQQEIDQLKREKQQAMAQQEKRIDFFFKGFSY